VSSRAARRTATPTARASRAGPRPAVEAGDPPLAKAVLRRISRSTWDTLGEAQRAEIRAAVLSASPRRHAIDVRGSIPLVFFRAYFVLLAGRDTRRGNLRVEDDRRARVVGLGWSIVSTLLALAIVAAALVGVYHVKCALGIDLIPGKHAWELFD